MPKVKFQEGSHTAAENAEFDKKYANLTPEEIKAQYEQTLEENARARVLADVTRKNRPGYLDQRRGLLLGFCKKAIAPHRTAACLMCCEELVYKGDEKAGTVICPDCGLSISFTDLDKIKV